MQHLATIALLLLSIQPTFADKLDTGIDDDDAFRPVFIRMSDQLLKQAGDYEAFGKQHANEKRAALRAEVLQTLRTKADNSWKAVEAKVKQLEKDGHLRGTQRYWICQRLRLRSERLCLP